MSNDGRIFITTEEAIALLPTGNDPVPTIIEAGNTHLMADWQRDEIIKLLQTGKPELTGKLASADGYGLAATYMGESLFINTGPIDTDKRIDLAMKAALRRNGIDATDKAAIIDLLATCLIAKQVAEDAWRLAVQCPWTDDQEAKAHVTIHAFKDDVNLRVAIWRAEYYKPSYPEDRCSYRWDNLVHAGRILPRDQRRTSTATNEMADD